MSPQNTIADELQEDFKALLIKIFSGLRKNEIEALRFYYVNDIPRNICDTFGILTALEDAGKILWTDVSSLKKVLSAISRKLLVETLEQYEVQRNASLLLDAFVRIRKDIPIPRQNLLENIETIAEYLANSPDCELDNSKVRSLRPSKLNIEQVMISLKKQIRKTNLLKLPTNRFLLLFVLAGELLCETETNNEEFAEPLPEDVSRCSTEICSTMTSLNEWVRPIDRKS